MDMEFTFYYLSTGQWIAIALFCAASLVAAARILRRAGLSVWWSIFLIIPLVNVIALWAVAYSRWPAVDGPRASSPSRVDMRPSS
jgi:hypothetical protein